MDRERVDAIKGLLVLAVVVGHNEAITYSFPWLRMLLYYFHVQCFFLLSSLLDTKPLSLRLLVDRAVRYLVPFVLFMIGAWIAYRLLRPSSVGLPASLAALGRALLTGDDNAIHVAVGMRYLWFLPALFSQVVLKATACRGGHLGELLVCVGVGWLATAAFVPANVRAAMPCGIAEGLFFFGFGEVFRRALGMARVNVVSPRTELVALAATLMLAACIIAVPLGRVAAADVGSYDIRDAKTWIAAIVFPCLMLPALFGLAGLLPGRLVGLVGRYSLPIYLVHMFVYRLLTRLRYGAKFDALEVVGNDLPGGIAILSLTIGLSLLISIGIWNLPRLRSLLFPRDWPEWRAALGLATV